MLATCVGRLFEVSCDWQAWLLLPHTLQLLGSVGHGG
jgi:hypothetical protein